MSLIRTTTITPLDPDSDKGREVAATMTRILDDIEIAIKARKLAAEVDSEPAPTTPAIPRPRRPLPVETGIEAAA